MEFYDYWARSKTIPVNGDKVKFATCVGYSNLSVEDALRVANERAEKQAYLINHNQPFDYDYNQLPFCEEVIDRFTKDDELVTVVSRVHYGSMVLNTTEVFFADIDLPPVKPKPRRGLFSFFTQGATPEPEMPGAMIVENLESVCDRNRGLGFRLYRTAAGFRAMATSRTFKVGDSYTTDLLNQLKSDKLYTVLCQRQKCFRARLTPKPYRIRMKNPPTRFPYQSPSQVSAMRQWQQQYEKACEGYATCAFVTHVGSKLIDEDVESICQLHDHFACKPDLPLA